MTSPGRFASSSRTHFTIPLRSARSPPTRGWRYSVLIGVLLPVSIAPTSFGMREALEAPLLQRIHRDDLCSPPTRGLELRQHPRVVGARVLSEDEDRVGET